MEMLRMTDISKSFPGTKALDGVDFYLKEREILSLLGENGAGKTTLMKVLYGMIQSDTGEIHYKGNKVHFKSPLDAINIGICMVHQHFMLVPAFTVIDNIIVGNEPKGGIFVDDRKAREEVAELIKRFNFNINPDTRVEKLSVGEQQRVEILKALYRKADVIILDEPTAVLTPHEVDSLFVILKKLKEEGKSIVIITHKLRETMAIADRINVLRDGRMIHNNVDPKEATIHTLSEMMVGREVALGIKRPAKNIGDTAFRVENLNVTEDGLRKIKDISFGIRKGEILGIAGIEGNGQTQLLESLTGLNKPGTMKVTLNDKEIKGSADTFLRNGIGHIPEDRLTMGLATEMSVRDNLILGYHKAPGFQKHGILLKKKIQDYSEKCRKDFGIKSPGVEVKAKSLSGGNQQKIVIARTFSHDPDVIIAAHPTRGVDVGAMEYIHTKLLDLRDQGKAVLLVSADLDEVRSLSDRILVLYEGRIFSESLPGELTEVQLGLLMTGSKLEEQEEVKNEIGKAD